MLNKITQSWGDILLKLQEDYGISDIGEFGLGPYKDFWKEYDIPKGKTIIKI